MGETGCSGPLGCKTQNSSKTSYAQDLYVPWYISKQAENKKASFSYLPAYFPLDVLPQDPEDFSNCWCSALGRHGIQ